MYQSTDNDPIDKMIKHMNDQNLFNNKAIDVLNELAIIIEKQQTEIEQIKLIIKELYVTKAKDYTEN